GPLWIPHVYNGKDKTFFFFSYEGLRLRLPQFSTTIVPSLCYRGQGSCSGASDKTAAAGLQPILRAFPIPNGAELLCAAPTASATTCPVGTPNGLSLFTSAYSNPSNLDTSSIKVEHNFG